MIKIIKIKILNTHKHTHIEKFSISKVENVTNRLLSYTGSKCLSFFAILALRFRFGHAISISMFYQIASCMYVCSPVYDGRAYLPLIFSTKTSFLRLLAQKPHFFVF
jgi:hypothetical protein